MNSVFFPKVKDANRFLIYITVFRDTVLFKSGNACVDKYLIPQDAGKSLARLGRKQAQRHVRDAQFQEHRDASCH